MSHNPYSRYTSDYASRRSHTPEDGHTPLRSRSVHDYSGNTEYRQTPHRRFEHHSEQDSSYRQAQSRTHAARSATAKRHAAYKSTAHKRHQTPSSSSQQRLALYALVGLVVVLLGIWVVNTLTTPQSGDAPSSTPLLQAPDISPLALFGTSESKETHPASTPRDQWTGSEMPFLYQIDTQFASAPYSGDTLEIQGCGPCALSMVYIYLTKDASLDPIAMSEFATQEGYATNKQGSSWTLMSEGSGKLGLRSRGIPADVAACARELEAGRPLVMVMKPGTFTTVGHFIVVEKLTEQGKAVVHDSNSKERSMQLWDLAQLCQEAQAIWSFERA